MTEATTPTLNLDYTNAVVLTELLAKDLGIVPADYRMAMFGKPDEAIGVWLSERSRNPNAVAKMLRAAYQAVLYYDALRALQTAETNLQVALR